MMKAVLERRSIYSCIPLFITSHPIMHVLYCKTSLFTTICRRRISRQWWDKRLTNVTMSRGTMTSQFIPSAHKYKMRSLVLTDGTCCGPELIPFERHGSYQMGHSSICITDKAPKWFGIEKVDEPRSFMWINNWCNVLGTADGRMINWILVYREKLGYYKIVQWLEIHVTLLYLM